MAPSRRNTNGRSPLVNQQRQITAFFNKSPSPLPTPSTSNQKLNPNPNPNPSPSTTPTTPSPLNPKPQNKPLLVIGASSAPSSTPSLYGQDVVGRRIKVYWPLDKAWYEGYVKSFDSDTSKHLIQYDDDEEESVDLSKEKIEWLHDGSSTKKLKRLRRGVPSIRKMVIEEDEVEECHEDDGGDDDSSDEDWGKNAPAEEADGDGEEEDIELVDEGDEEDVAEGSKRKPSTKVEPRKRKMGGAEKLEPAKKSKSGGEVAINKGAVKLSVLDTNTLEGQ